MKTGTIITGLLLILSVNLSAQLKYEGTLDSRYKTIQIDDGAVRYIKYNKDEKKVLIYNLDNSLWRSINLPLPKNHFLDEIKNISSHTFNDDDFVEIVYSCVVYNVSDKIKSSNDDYIIVEFTLNIISESGESILKIPGSNEMEIIETEEEKKLLIYKHIGKHFGNDAETIIYSFSISWQFTLDNLVS